MTVAPLIAMKSTKCDSLEAVGKELDRGIAARIFEELDEIAKLEDPRVRGKSLTGNLAGVWRYRVGDYRILCAIEDGRLVILVVDVAVEPKERLGRGSM